MSNLKPVQWDKTASDLQFNDDGTPTSISLGSSSGNPISFGGRLTLTSAKPIMVADAVAQGTIYYAPLSGRGVAVSVYNGTSVIAHQFTSSDTDNVGLSLALDSNAAHTNYHQSGKIFDLFIYWSGSACVLATGPAWSSDTARGTGAGTTELQMFKGIWTNKNSITLRFGVNSGDTTSIAANQATYVGSALMTANGQTGIALRPTRANGGTNNVLGLYNAYNRRITSAICQDLVSPNGYSSYNSATVRSFNNSSSNAITWIDGLQESFVDSKFSTSVCNNGVANGAYTVGCGIDQNTALGGGLLPQTAFHNTQNDGCPAVGTLKSYPLLGKHTVFALEQSTTVTMIYFGNDFCGLELELEM